jgi:hypothetical protein
MAKKHSNRRKAQTTKRESAADRADRLQMELIGVRAAVMTTALVLQGCGVMDEVGVNLRRAALKPLDKLIGELAEVAHG